MVVNRACRSALTTLAIAAMLAPAGGARSEEPPLPTVAEVTPPLPTMPTVADITHRLDALYRSDASHGTLKMEVVTKHYSRTLAMEAWTKGADLALVVIREPAREAGNASLKTADGLWSYGKRSDRLLRIPPGLLGESWMGSHFTNDDLMRESSYEQDYDTTVARVDDGGQPRLVLRMVPKPDTAIVYTKLEYFLTPDDLMPVRLDCYDEDKVARQMSFEDVRELGGRRLPTVLRLVPSDAPNEHTIVTYLAMTFDLPIPDGTFTQRGLRRATER